MIIERVYDGQDEPLIEFFERNELNVFGIGNLYIVQLNFR